MLRFGISMFVLGVLVRNIVVLVVIYANFLFLIPRFFRKGKYVIYSLLTLTLIAASVWAMSEYDQYRQAKMGYPALTFSEMIQELLFYSFNLLTYILTAFLLYSLQEKQEQKEKLDQVQLEKLGTEIKYLRAQINPHFLFNTLNNLYGLALEKSEKTPEIVLKLSRIMDYMLYESNDGKVYLKKDIENVVNYIDIERIRQGNNAEIKFEVKGQITDQTVVPLMLLPLVENAFKHGVNTIIRGAYMHVSILVNGNELEIDVRNNFKKFDEGSDRNGIGLANLEKRLDLFYPGAHTMNAESIGDDYHVNLKLNLS